MGIQAFDDLFYYKIHALRSRVKLVVYVFMIDGLLIDTGPAKMRDELISLYEEWNISEVILTHHHEDHSGLARWLQKNKNVPIYTHELGVEYCKKKSKLPFYRQFSWGASEPFQPIPLSRIHETNKYKWEIIHTPGHTDDHISLFNQEKGWMIGGDLYVHPTPKSMFSFESVPQTIESLKKVLTYDFQTYICSHAGIILKGRQAIERKLNYLIGVQQEVLSLHSKGMSPKSIQKEMFPKMHPMNLLSLFENSPKHIVHSILK